KPKAEEAPEADEEEAGPEGKGKAFTPKAKPKIDPATRHLLRLRREIAARRPAFRRQEWFRHQRLGDAWRKPMGQHTKLRRHLGYRPNVVSIGYRGPKAVRGLHPSGFREVLVHTVRELESVDPALTAVRIAGPVGARKRIEIQAAADEKGIRVLNRRGEE
ncbi:MAG: 50S ribosomal protein L32e, partial [Candidatus Thermoplasmatota archaeon]